MAAKIFGDVCLKTSISQNKIHASYLTQVFHYIGVWIKDKDWFQGPAHL